MIRVCDMCNEHALSGEEKAAFADCDHLARQAAAFGTAARPLGFSLFAPYGCDVCEGGADLKCHAWVTDLANPARKP